jgi:protein-S-isoprenylcysteine O-methyltransferase Ste14
MLKLPPPFWALAFILIAVGASYLMGWPRVPGLPLVWPGVVLIALGIGLSMTAAMLFRREGTAINPTSPANQKLVTSGPFKLTRNPMYLGLVLVTLGIALWIGAWPIGPTGSEPLQRHDGFLLVYDLGCAGRAATVAGSPPSIRLRSGS